MPTFWTRKGDQEDDDEKTAKPFAEYVSHGNINTFPKKKPTERNDEADTE